MSDRVPPISLIAAMTADRVLGIGDHMPWDVPEEYARYVETVRDATVIFGRKSYEIFGADLNAAQMVVVTRQPSLPEVRVASGLEEALALAGTDGREVFVAGGASIYKRAIPLVDRMLLSTIHGDFDGDVFFPEFDESAWRVATLEEHPKYTFREWVRAAS